MMTTKNTHELHRDGITLSTYFF